MPKFYIRFLTPLIFCFLFVVFSKNAFALIPYTITPTNPDGNATRLDENTIQIKVEFHGFSPNDYKYCLEPESYCATRANTMPEQHTDGTTTTLTFNNLCADGEIFLKIVAGGCQSGDYFWGTKTYHVHIYDKDSLVLLGDAQIHIDKYYPDFKITSNNGLRPNAIITATVEGSRRPQNNGDRNDYTVEITGNPNPSNNNKELTVLNNGPEPVVFNSLNINAGDYTARLKGRDNNHDFTPMTINFNIDENGGSITGGSGGNVGAGVGKNPCTPEGCETALGFIPTTVKAFTEKILAIATGIAGGIALILMVIGSIRVLASSGDPKAVGAGREMIVAAVAGLVFLIFAVLILRFVGISIFGGIAGFI